MNKGTKDIVEGKGHEAKGAVKEEAGKIIHDKKLEAEGLLEKQAGKLQQTLGHAEQAAGRK